MNFTLLKRVVMLCFTLYSCSIALANAKIDTFSQAKKAGKQLIFKNKIESKTFYCQCDIRFPTQKINKWEPDLNSCGYTPYRSKKLANAIEWEHIVPAEEFGRQRACWRGSSVTKKGKVIKGRENCRATDRQFNLMEGDLFNLVPSIAEVNRNRSNYRYSPVSNRLSSHQYGRCEMTIDKQARRAVPPKYTRGEIARIYLYMQQQYQLKIAATQLKIYQVWDKSYPVTKQECNRERAISQLMKRHNMFVQKQCRLLNR